MSRKVTTHQRSSTATHSNAETIKLAKKVPKRLWKYVHCRKHGPVIPVYLVDGAYVRANIDVGWIGGGHDLIDTYISKHSIWIEDIFGKDDQLAFLVHELHERDLMETGMSYDKAHEDANAVECLFRRSQLKTKAAVKTEGDI